jgi:hypothetical protein
MSIPPETITDVASPQSGSRQKYLRSESAVAVIGKAMAIYVRHFGVLLLTVAIPTLPFDILAFAGLKEGDRPLAIAASVTSSLAALFAFSALCVVGSDICMGNKPSLRRAYRRIFGAPFAYVTINSLLVLLCLTGAVIPVFLGMAAVDTVDSCLAYLAVMGAGLLFVLLIGLHLMYVPAISALEMKPGFRRALQRSSFLGRGRRFRSFVVLAVISLFSTAMTIVLMLLVTMPSLNTSKEPRFEPYLNVSLQLFLPLFALATLLMYYDLRSHKEAFDLPSRDESIRD